MKFLAKIFGTRNDKLIKKIMPLVKQINDLEPSFEKLSNEQLKEKTKEFRTRYEKGESLDSILPEAFANCREASKRILGQRHYDVQLLGGIVLNQGKITEMKTGEGKTLTATLPSYLHGLTGKGAHVVTVNDYLAKRDAEWMGKLHNFLGLSVGAIVHGLSDLERQEAYAADITYGTNNEFGFDYLRDNMKTDPRHIVQRGHNFAIVDEVDSILIDEARTPLIISGAADSNLTLYKKIDREIPGIQKDIDYTLDEKNRTISLTEDGINKMEQRLGLDNLYASENADYLHHIKSAMRAHLLFKKDVDYVVRNGEVIIVDEFTGRLMPGRRYSDGLHGALEAKEHVEVQRESQTLATITFQNYFRLYSTLAGMTGTADTEAVEFHKIYGLDVVVIPTNKSLVREDEEDVLYSSLREKFNAIASEVAQAQKRGQPVLVGTASVEKSELLSSLLDRMGIQYNLLNAKNHAREASIIAEAGEKGRVTIATNMAGRGTDIVLGEGVREIGGLLVIGTERHESRRIDNQLRGRAGRQGDPGRSKFFISFEDDLMRIFANADKMSAFMAKSFDEGEALKSSMFTRVIENAQKRVEEQNFSSRKHLLEYDDVMNQQRQVIYARRNLALNGKADMDFMWDVAYHKITKTLESFSPEFLNKEAWDLVAAEKKIQEEFMTPVSFKNKTSNDFSEHGLTDDITEQLKKFYEEKMSFLKEDLKKFESYIYLQIIDQSWKDHLLGLDHLKDSVSLRGFGQRDPLQEYKKEAFDLFAQLIDGIEEKTTLMLLRMPPPEPVRLEQLEEELHGEEADLESNMNFSHAEAESSLSTPKEKEIDNSPHKREEKKVGRNELCPCGSGKKHKKCHGA
jgi:preprotein translocase subunit SecA